MHQNMSISLFSTPFDHFHFHSLTALIWWVLLRSCHINLSIKGLHALNWYNWQDYVVVRVDVEKQHLEKLKKVSNVHNLTGLIKLFFRWTNIFASSWCTLSSSASPSQVPQKTIFQDRIIFWIFPSRELKDPLFNDEMNEKITDFVKVKFSLLATEFLIFQRDQQHSEEITVQREREGRKDELKSLFKGMESEKRWGNIFWLDLVNSSLWFRKTLLCLVKHFDEVTYEIRSPSGKPCKTME